MKIALILLLLSSTCYADEWTRNDTAFQTAYTVMHCADWSQTLHSARNTSAFEETNSFLGKHPSERDVNRYFLGTLVLHTAISYVLPGQWRRTWQVVWIGIEYQAVNHNRGQGLGVNFRF